MLLICSIIAIIGCSTAGMSLAILIFSNLYVTRFQQIGVIAGLAIGLILMGLAALLAPKEEARAGFHYLVIYVIMFASLVLGVQVLIKVISELKTGMDLRGIVIILAAGCVYWLSRLLVMRFNKKRAIDSARSECKHH